MDEFAVGRPSPALRPWCVAYHGYRTVDAAPAVHRGLPSPWLTFIITLDDPLVVAAHPDSAQQPDTYDALIGGLHTRPALITHDGRQSGIQLLLHPVGARALLGLPAGELATQDLHADDVVGRRVEHLRDRLRNATSWPERFELLDATLVTWLRDTVAPQNEVVHAWHLLGRGARPGQVARHVGWSARHLGQRLRAETGLTPQAAARVIRFDRTRREFAAHPDVRLADLAATQGFYDQAHLSREFRSCAGLSPSGWLAAEQIAIVQATAIRNGPS